MAKLYIGTSGWIYPHWDAVFYPLNLPSKGKLKYFSKYFKTTEINYSFYHLPSRTTFERWYQETPPDFVFSLKASRYLTHIKRLKGIKKAWSSFLKNALFLKEKLGPVLFQLPPSFKNNQENFKRLNEFLKFIFTKKSRQKLKFCFEFRHQSWCQEKIYQLLKKYKMAWVIADSPAWPKAEKVTAPFVYFRMHGSKILFSSNYTNKELKTLAQKIKNYLKRNLEVYIYFNNDSQGFAVKNAKELKNILKSY